MHRKMYILRSLNYLFIVFKIQYIKIHLILNNKTQNYNFQAYNLSTNLYILTRTCIVKCKTDGNYEHHIIFNNATMDTEIQDVR